MRSSSLSTEVPIAQSAATAGRGIRRLVAALLIISALLTTAYSALSIFVATKLVYAPQKPLYSTPAAQGMQFKYVTFPSREDHIQLQAWFIPGVLHNGSLTSQRTIVLVHGNRTNRADPAAGLLNLSAAFAHNGFAVLAFDMRGTGQSPPEPLSLGYFEQRDVLGAVDFLRSGPIPYPNLGRPRAIVGWGVSMGAATLDLAASQEPAIRAVVSDCAYADIIPILEREIPKGSNLPQMFSPGTLLASQVLYGMNFYDVRPLDVVSRIAPRPILFIHGDKDTFIPLSNMYVLAAAARTGAGANVQTWLVPGAAHAQSFNTLGEAYVARVIAFYTSAVGPDSGAV